MPQSHERAPDDLVTGFLGSFAPMAASPVSTTRYRRRTILGGMLALLTGFVPGSTTKADTPEESHVLDTAWPAITSAEMPERCQISGVALDSDGNVLALGRGENHWMPGRSFKQQKIRKPTVLVVDPNDGTLRKAWGENLFVMPHQIVIGPGGDTWVVDTGQQRVFRFDAHGRKVASIGGPSVRFNMPTDIAFLGDGSFVVSDGYLNSRIVKFTADGKPMAAWGSKGTGPLEFQTPHSVTVDDRDRIYVADRENSRVQILTPDGKFISAWQNVDRPITVRFAAGHVFVLSNLEADRGIVRRFDTDGRLLESFHTKPPGDHGDFEWPHGLAVSADGDDVYVGFTLTGRRVQRYRRVKPSG